MMTTGTTIMIVCAVLYGLIIILFKDKDKRIASKEDWSMEDDPTLGADGSIGSHRLLASDFDKVSSE
jgi:hypothetical protein